MFEVLGNNVDIGNHTHIVLTRIGHYLDTRFFSLSFLTHKPPGPSIRLPDPSVLPCISIIRLSPWRSAIHRFHFLQELKFPRIYKARICYFFYRIKFTLLESSSNVKRWPTVRFAHVWIVVYNLRLRNNIM